MVTPRPMKQSFSSSNFYFFVSVCDEGHGNDKKPRGMWTVPIEFRPSSHDGQIAWLIRFCLFPSLSCYGTFVLKKHFIMFWAYAKKRQFSFKCGLRVQVISLVQMTAPWLLETVRVTELLISINLLSWNIRQTWRWCWSHVVMGKDFTVVVYAYLFWDSKTLLAW